MAQPAAPKKEQVSNNGKLMRPLPPNFSKSPARLSRAYSDNSSSRVLQSLSCRRYPRPKGTQPARPVESQTHLELGSQRA